MLHVLNGVGISNVWQLGVNLKVVPNKRGSTVPKKLYYYYYYLFILNIKFILAYSLLGGGLLVKSRSQQEIKPIYPSTYRMLCAVLISVIFCSTMADRWPGSNWRLCFNPFL